MTEKCKFVLNDTNNCICKNSHHNMWKFGIRWNDPKIYFDEVNFININHCFSLEDFDLAKEHYDLFKSFANSNQEINYFANCNCKYCTYAKNKESNIFEECFCCKGKLYMPNFDNNYLRCCDCNSILCNNCFIQGRYADYDNGTFCYDCRKFSFHKNSDFYGLYAGPYDDWDNASWYY